MVKNLPAMWETRLWSLGREDPLEKGLATHSSILTWKIPWTEEPVGLQSMRVAKGWPRLSAHTQEDGYIQVWVDHSKLRKILRDGNTRQHYLPPETWMQVKKQQFELDMKQSVQLLSHVRPLATPWTAAHQASLSITNSWSLPKLMSIELVMPSNHLILCCPLLLLPSIFSSIRVFSFLFIF